MRLSFLSVASLVALSGVLVAACQDDSDTTSTGSPVDDTSSTPTSSTGAGAQGGGGVGAQGSGGNGVGAQGGGGSAANPCSQGDDHLLISEVATYGAADEFVEIWNPGTEAVDLSNHYISDNSAYYTLTDGVWDPDATPGTDFLAQFPPGTSIAPLEYLTISAGTDFFAAYSSCPDFVLYSDGPAMCDGNNVPSMVDPPNGSIGTTLGSMLSNNREMIVLFCWDGQSATVADVDYVAWGDDDELSSRVDKSDATGYADDTAIASQDTAPAYRKIFGAGGGGGVGGGGGAGGSAGVGGGLPVGESIGRCDDFEDGETQTGGNGIAGHDETSEQMGTSFEVIINATPGASNGCDT